MFIWPVIALVAILLAVRFFGARDSAGFVSDNAVRLLLREEHPEFTPIEVTRTIDRQGALAVGPGDEPLAVAFTVGNQVTSRLLSRGDAARVEAHPRVGIVDAVIVTRDVGAPRFKLSLTEEEWRRWEGRIRRVAGNALTTVIAALLGVVTGARSVEAHPRSGPVVALAQGPFAAAFTQRAAACDGTITVRTEPASPRPGAFFRVVVSGTGGLVTGRAGDQALHFEAGRVPEEQVALAGAGIDEKALPVVVRCPGSEGDSLMYRVALAPGSYPTERLRVAPEFGAEPDSALANRIAREGERARQVGAQSHETPRLWTGYFSAPRKTRITSGFGRGRMFNGRITSRHMGTDFAGLMGAPVAAVNRGVVRIVDRFYYGGNVVYVDHGAGVTTAYLHLSKFLVNPGDTVSAGQVIGEVGATGRVTGPHLHLIARYGTLSLDPASLLRLEGPPRVPPATSAPRSAR